jgi:hypothetical protein
MSGSKRRRPRELSRLPRSPEEHWILELYCAGHSVNPEKAARDHLRQIVRDLKSGRKLLTAYREWLADSLQAEVDGTPFAKAFGLQRSQRTRSKRTSVRDAWIAMDYVLRMREGGKAAAIAQELAVLWGLANARPKRKERQSVVEAAHSKFGDLARFAIRDHAGLMSDVYGETEAQVLAGLRRRTDAGRAEWLAWIGRTPEN